MSESYTLKELVHRVAEKDASEVTREVTNQVQHWVNSGLLGYVGLDRGALSVGRGRLRRYKADLVYWCRLLRVLGKNGMSLAQMRVILAEIEAHQKRAKREKKTDLVKFAFGGKFPEIYLVIYYPDLGSDEAVRVKFSPHPVTIEPLRESAMLFNLSKIFAGVRP